MREVRFDHIAIATRRMTDGPPVLVGALGGRPTGDGGPSGAYTWGHWSFEGGGRLELLEPLGADSFLHRFLAGHGPGVHHVTFVVPTLQEACDRAVAQGYRIVGFDDSDPGWAEAFLHPKDALGIVVQIVESRASGGERRPWAAPAGPASPPAPVTMLGLRMRVRSAARAETQWRGILQGVRDAAEDGALTYRWPGSPMRIAVDVDPDADEGPVAIEYASARPVALAATPHPVLGATFRPVRS
jgi:methylmalonyl-CoA/ethylmalonyl-CoA epimerase